MCRFAAYLGPPVPLAGLLYGAPHSLHEQAYAPRHQRSGNVNVDGTGVAWWLDDDAEPLRYVTERPPWSDPNLPALSARLQAGMQLAAVRSATPGMPFGPAAVAPFTAGSLAGVHNGKIGRFGQPVVRELTGALPDELFASLETRSDSHVLFLTIVAAWYEDPTAGLSAAVAAGLARVARVCGLHGAAATLNVVVADGQRWVAARAAVAAPADTLWTLQGGKGWPGAALAASEPLDDDPGWQTVAAGSLVEATADGMRIQRLPDLEGLT